MRPRRIACLALSLVSACTAPATVPAPSSGAPLAPTPVSEARDPRAANAGDRVHVTVVDDSSRPIASARVVVLRRGDTPFEAGVTTSTGELAFELPEGASRTCVVADGFAIGRALGSHGERDPIVLRPQGRIAGVVTSGGEPFANALVLAWNHAHPAIPPGILQRGLRGDPDVAWAASGPSGEFALEHLDAGAEYELIACSPSMFGRPQERVVRASKTSSASIELRPVHALLLSFDVDDGDAILAPDALVLDDVLHVAPVDANAKLELLPRELVPVLFPTPCFGYPPPWSPVLVCSGGDREQPVALHVDARYPGYEPQSFDVDLEVAEPGELVDRSVRLKARRSGWGVVEVEVQPNAVATPFGAERLELTDESGDRWTLAFTDEDVGRQPIELPNGSYRAAWTLSAFPDAPVVDARAIVLGGDEDPARLTFEPKARASLFVTVLRGDDSVYTGPCTVSVRHVDGTGAVGHISFEAPPYSFGGALPGEYEIEVERPDGGVPARIDVEPDRGYLFPLRLR